MSGITVELVPATRLGALRGDLGLVYCSAFEGPPWYEDRADRARFSDRFDRHRLGDGFAGAVATDNRGSVVGFAYGLTTDVDWPDDVGHDRLYRSIGPMVARSQLHQSFELAELAVQPACQRQGIGARIHDTLLASVPHSRAWLVTRIEATAAGQLYRRRGWQAVAEVSLPGLVAPRLVMSLDLARSLAIAG